jgi:hypothetical protein
LVLGPVYTGAELDGWQWVLLADGREPDIEIALVVDGVLGCEGGAGREGESGEVSCETHDDGCDKAWEGRSVEV